mmetsp:Transcript_20784/g.30937  ORF Transcript_20784/g.30937 Transcript_20784/m.30937 type:complete len:313 (-) Transcript_20784:112-1050(-)|eukprot:CAMPEP_0201553126 /NCGR_PEP_ID=MMETSP0173_2-20130828/19457_1 /ASSEMBLY_ACC=CAM_ASM_000268 /TAXON_ID=218659 /ORGANISM="Vexillifera sp., Strain DIVA3 564/2" /LENGTH=312 /DNA_ID=CAMNT_0047963741 /DNA_START=78 /DNA_END=1016 /DNA_ORIENTATION=-
MTTVDPGLISASLDSDSVSDGGGLVDLSSVRQNAQSSANAAGTQGLFGLGFDIDDAIKDMPTDMTFSTRDDSGSGNTATPQRPSKRQKSSGGGIFSCFRGNASEVDDDDDFDDDDEVMAHASGSLQSATASGSGAVGAWRKDAPELGDGYASMKPNALAEKDQYSLVQVLSHSEARRYLKLYASKEFSVENMLCWEALTDYLNEKDPKKKVEIFVTIVETFFAPNSPQHVTLTLDEIVLAQLKENLEGNTSAMGELEKIDQIVEEGKLALELTNLHDIYIRFKKSPDFLEMCKSANFSSIAESSSTSTSSTS